MDLEGFKKYLVTRSETYDAPEQVKAVMFLAGINEHLPEELRQKFTNAMNIFITETNKAHEADRAALQQKCDGLRKHQDGIYFKVREGVVDDHQALTVSYAKLKDKYEAADSKVKELEIVKTSLQKNIADMDESRLEMDKNYGRYEGVLLEAHKLFLKYASMDKETTIRDVHLAFNRMLKIMGHDASGNKIAWESLEAGKGD